MRGSAEDPNAVGDSEVTPLAHSVKRAADLLDLSERKVWQLIDENKIESFKVGWSRRIPHESLVAFVKSQQSA